MRPPATNLPATGDDATGRAVMDEQLEFWREHLSGAPALLEVPTDRARPAVRTHATGSVPVALPAPLASSLRSLSARHGTTMLMTLLAGWSALLSRLAGQPQVVIGTPVRRMADPSGSLSNTLALLLDLGSDPSVSELLAQVKTRMLAGVAHQDLPFEQLVAALQPVSSSSHSPLFQAMLALDQPVGGGLLAPDSPAAPAAAGLDLSLFLADTGEGMIGRLEYASDLFDGSTASRWLEHFKRVLEEMAADDSQPISGLPLLSAADRARLLLQFNPVAAYPGCGLIHELFEAQVALTPDAPAVACQDEQVSYAELNRRANRVAHRLLSLGVRPDDRVAICAERSLALVVGLLGILKAGGAYVPLDPAYPAERLAYMLSDSAPVAVLTQAGLLQDVLACLPTDAGVPVLALDGDDGSQGLALQPAHNPEAQVLGLQPANLAYVIYTSGSTGKPKGVMVEHGNVTRLFAATEENFHFDRSDVWTLFHSFAFDFSVWEIFGALLYGGRLVVVPALQARNALEFYELLCREGVTVLNQTPSAFRQLILAQGQSEARHALRYIVFGGEALDFRMLAPWIERPSNQRTQLVNMYGITEITVHATYYRLSAADLGSPQGSMVGKPISDLRIYILDKHRQPAPLGVAGELYVGGAGVARGYLNRPELTAERFIADPFAADPGSRLYKTGDLGRYRADGTIEYLGRNDFQLKIRGFRIELGEIESRLQGCPGVREAVVLAREDSPGDKRLVAYYVPNPTTPGVAPARAPELRKHLAEVLPEYMVPALYVALEQLPVTINGKLDRAALPVPGINRPELAVGYAPPIDAEEARLCDAFAAVLGIERVGRHDNFFELGGSSLLALRLLARMQEGVERALPATLVFANPTPAGLAVALAHGVGDAVEANRLPDAHRSAAAAADRLAATDSAKGHDPIAIIAMAGRFPGARDVEQFWENLCAGRESITVFRADELDPAIPAAERLDPAYVPARGIIDEVENFDAAFFGIGPRDAELMDPQHRIFLELCWECLERGGHVPDAATVPVGVFAGTWDSTYLRRHVGAHPDLVEKVGAFQVLLANEKDFIATRVANKLNLTGPAISMYTACSTSLVAICQGLDSLRAGHCDMALAGGVAITCPPRSGYLHQDGTMLSPDGHTRAFDAQAQGTVFSDGAAVVLLKRLSDAIRDGNPVHAVILGGAVNNDGGGKASFTAPSSEGQAAVIAMAQADARVSPRSISYLEAHGTATPLGDPIEIEGLVKAFRRLTPDIGFCRIGSVKSNIGHLVIAAGATGVIKTALALSQRRIPASLHFEQANPVIDFASSPFVVNSALSAWTGEAPLRAGVSSFGVGGTNAHVVLEQAPALAESEAASGPSLLVLSARTPTALAQATTRLADFLQADLDRSSRSASEPQAAEPAKLADVAWTLAIGRKAFAHRIAVVCSHTQEAISQLRSPEIAAAVRRSRSARHCEPVFTFPGQGSHYAGMGRALYETEPGFSAAFDQCVDALRDGLSLDLKRSIFSDDPAALLPTAVMQPAIFCVEYALARFWMSRGLIPAAMIGHSVGEFVAATLAGVFALPDALMLVARRGALMQSQPAGAMLSVKLALDALLRRLPDDLSLAAENAPGSCVVSGRHEGIARFRQELEADGVACRELHTSHAFHSAMMDPVVDPFRELVAAVPRSAPKLKIVSGTSGDWLDAATATSPEYWSRHLREPVRYAAALARVLDVPGQVLLEVGPRAMLSTLARQHPDAQKNRIVAIASLGDAQSNEQASLRLAAGQLWCQGADCDPAAFDRRTRRRRLLLPTYPFERQRFWVDAGVAETAKVLTHPAALRALTPGSGAEVAAPPMPAAAAAPVASAGGEALRPGLLKQLAGVFEDVAGFGLGDTDGDTNFMELGLDSLMLTQVALQLQKTFNIKISFRQLMGECATMARLATMLEAKLPAQPPVVAVAARSAEPVIAGAAPAAAAAARADPAAMPGQDPLGLLREVIQQQMRLMAQQLALLSGGSVQASAASGGPDSAEALIDAQLLALSAAQSSTQGAPAESAAEARASGPTVHMDTSGRPEFAEGQDPHGPATLSAMEAMKPVAAGARLGREPDGTPAWFIPNPELPGKFLRIGS